MLESCYKYSLKLDVHRCSSKHLLLKSLQILLENTCLRVFFNKVAGLQNIFFSVNFVNYSRTPILLGIYERLILKQHWAFLKTSFLQNISSGCFWQFQVSSVQLMFFCVFCRIFLEHLLTEHLRMTAYCVYLWILRICLIQAKKNIKNKKYYSFRKCRWREISSPVRLQKFFFNRFSGDLLFF